jgi:hypothetical protein
MNLSPNARNPLLRNEMTLKKQMNNTMALRSVDFPIMQLEPRETISIRTSSLDSLPENLKILR